MLRSRSSALLAALAAFTCALSASVTACGADEAIESEPEKVAVEPESSAPEQDASSEPAVVGPAVECALGAAIEIEGNDTPQTANVFTELSFCGVLATPEDVDYATFETPPDTTLALFQGVIEGKVDFELTLGGQTFGPGETSKFGPGTYVVKAFTKAGKPASYRFRVQFDPR